MRQFRWRPRSALVAAILAAACAAEGTVAEDCTAIEKLDNVCGLRVGNLTPDECGNVYYFLPGRCQGAIHSYLTCAAGKSCKDLNDPNTCLGLDQAMAVACAEGNATVTDNPNDALTTSARAQLGKRASVVTTER